MKVFERFKHKVFIEDCSIKVTTRDGLDFIEVPNDVIKDGIIEDYSHLFYIFKKYIENKSINNISLILSSSSILQTQVILPKINEEEINEMAAYELGDILPINIEEYYLRNVSNILDDKIEVDVGLIKKSIVDGYRNLFEKLGVNVIELYGINDVILDYDFVNLSVNNIVRNYKEIKQNDFNDSISNIMRENNISYLSMTNILDDKFEDLSNAEKDKIKSALWLDIYSKLKKIENEVSNKVIFSGELLTDKVRDYIDENFNKEVIYSDLNNFNFDNKYSYIKPKKNNFKIYAFISGILIINLLIFIALSYNVKDEENSLEILNLEKQELSNRIETENLNSLKSDNDKLKSKIESYESLKLNLDKNKKFEDLFLKLDNLNNEDIIFTEYNFIDNKFYVSGISRNESSLINVLNGLKTKYEIVQKDIKDSIISFRINIELEEME